MEKPEEFRHIVRIMNKDLDGNKTISRALMAVKGVSHRFAKVAAAAFEKETGISKESKLGNIPEEIDKKIEGILTSPEKHSIPEWMFNRRKDYVTGDNKHLIMSDLDFSLREDVKRMERTKSYKGVRHALGLPVRGQRTKTGFRRGGTTVGVFKKEQGAQAKAAAPAEKAKK
ncbi:MAG: 30S ribosomal protein S13 [archaeon]